jgi:hypothetical protein
MIPSYSVQKGRLEARDRNNDKVIFVEFQYNPYQIIRTIKPQYLSSDPFRIKDVPEETLSFKMELDATGRIDQTKSETMGIYPQLSLLEILVYPQSSKIRENSEHLNKGEIVILPPDVPELLLVLGDKRVLPVQIQSMTVTEMDYDCSLTPIRAEVSLTLRVFNYSEVFSDHPTFDYLLAYHMFKERMARGG